MTEQEEQVDEDIFEESFAGYHLDLARRSSHTEDRTFQDHIAFAVASALVEILHELRETNKELRSMTNEISMGG